jgi:MFS family permease
LFVVIAMSVSDERASMRLPFFYGWIIIAVTFVTMAIGVNARTAFSLFFPPIIGEFGWERGITAGAFSFGFVVSAIVSPLIGRLMDRLGPRAVMELGVALIAGGLLLAPLTKQPWHLYLTIGVLVGAGSVCLGYSGQSLFLPNWFNRRRGLTSIMGAVVVEIFQGKHYGSIFGTVMVAALAGGAAGPLVTGVLHDLSGSYTLAFLIGIGVSGVSAGAIWLASPGKIRAVAGRSRRLPA